MRSDFRLCKIGEVIEIERGKIIPFPVSGSAGQIRLRGPSGERVHRCANLPGFRVVSEEERRLGLRLPEDRRIDRALDLDFESVPLVIEFDDPTCVGKRKINICYLAYNAVRWRMVWMDRSQVKGKMRYGLRRG